MSDKLLFAIQKADDFFYVVYAYDNGEYLSDDYGRLNTTYYFAKVDFNGNVLQSVDTEINTMLKNHYYYSVSVRRDIKNNLMEINIGDKIYCQVDLDSFKVIDIKNK